jgi:hypothetical protein
MIIILITENGKSRVRGWNRDFGDGSFYNGFTLLGCEPIRMVLYGDGNLVLP